MNYTNCLPHLRYRVEGNFIVGVCGMLDTFILPINMIYYLFIYYMVYVKGSTISVSLNFALLYVLLQFWKEYI